MSAASLAADATRAGIGLWQGNKYIRTAQMNRTAIIAEVYGPGHIGFKGAPAAVDAHVSTLVDAFCGQYGRALQIALRAYASLMRERENLAKLEARKRGRDHPAIAESQADIEQWSAIFRASHGLYLAARAVRSEPDLGLLPDGCEAPGYLEWQPMWLGRPAGQPVREQWRITKPAHVTKPVTALAAAAANAVSRARSAADAANVLRVARLAAAPVVPIPLTLGIKNKPALRRSVGQGLVAELERFVTRLDAEVGKKVETVD